MRHHLGRWGAGLAIALTLSACGTTPAAPPDAPTKAPDTGRMIAKSKRSDVSDTVREALDRADFLMAEEAKADGAPAKLRLENQALEVVQDALTDVQDRAGKTDLDLFKDRTYAKRIGELAETALWKIDTLRTEGTPKAQTPDAQLELADRLYREGYQSLQLIQRETDTKTFRIN